MKKTKKWGYQAYEDEDGKKKTIHSRMGEKKYGYEKIPKNFHIHHIDGDKNNNQYHNLIILHKKDHARIHVKRSLIIKSVRPKDNPEEDE